MIRAYTKTWILKLDEVFSVRKLLTIFLVSNSFVDYSNGCSISGCLQENETDLFVCIPHRTFLHSAAHWAQ
jgi:hypothetical protein